MPMRRPSTPRIAPADIATTPVTSVMNAVNVRATLAHNPVVARGVAALGGALLNEGTIPPREREIAILRMGWNCQSVYEFGQHTLMARSVGLSPREIYDLTRPIDCGTWSAGDAAVVQMVDELYTDDCVSDATFAELATRWSHREILELMAAALCYRMISGLLNSCGVALDDGVPGWPAAVD